MGLEAMSRDERRDRSALLILVDALDPLIGAYRRAFTADGASVPPHVTLLNPFLAPDEITSDVRSRIARMAAAIPAFDYVVGTLDAFPGGVTYLTVEPTAPFLGLIDRLQREFQEVSSYWKQYDDIVPHITVADAARMDDHAELHRIEANISQALPLRCRAREIVLLQRVRPSPAPWDVQGRFSLRP